MTSPEAPHEPAARNGDGGFTQVEILLSVVLTTILVGALAAALLTTLRVTPTTEDRIDDARSTRSLSTWLTQDTMSTPPFHPEEATGGFDVATAASANNNDCGASGSNVVHLQWTESTSIDVTYVANYRFVVDGDEARLHRVLCSSENGGPFQLTADRAITPGLDPSAPPTATLSTDPTTGDVTLLSFELIGVSGESIVIATSSRNPSEFYPT